MSYRFFSQFCDSDDWHAILQAIAGAVVKNSKPGVPISLLDIGCGNGIATETICEMILSATGNLPKLEVVEPSLIVRSQIEANLLRSSDGGVLDHPAYESVDVIPSDTKFDAVILLHSMYYIPDFSQTLKSLVKRHMYPNGRVIALVLPESSSFFLGLPPMANCLESVWESFREIGLVSLSSHKLRSRFHLPQKGNLTEKEWTTLCTFFRPDGITVNACKERILTGFHDDTVLDFADHIVIGNVGAK